MRGFRSVTFVLVGLNIAVALATMFVPGVSGPAFDRGALYFPGNTDQFEGWQLLTSMFLHGGALHLLFNMFALYSFGTLLEQRWGPGRFAVFYFVCGIGAGLIYSGVNWLQFENLRSQIAEQGWSAFQIENYLRNGTLPRDWTPPEMRAQLLKLATIYWSPTVGASGAVYGLLVAFGCLYPNAKLALMFIPVPIAAKYLIPGLLLLDLFSGVTGISLFGGNIANFAHIGGAIVGFVFVLLWRRPQAAPHPFR